MNRTRKRPQVCHHLRASRNREPNTNDYARLFNSAGFCPQVYQPRLALATRLLSQAQDALVNAADLLRTLAQDTPTHLTTTTTTTTTITPARAAHLTTRAQILASEAHALAEEVAPLAENESAA